MTDSQLILSIAILGGTGRGAREGILIKSGEARERNRHLDVILFDKTGTLTQGKPVVTDSSIPLLPNLSADLSVKALASAEALAKAEEWLGEVASLESSSEHPLAQAIVRYASEHKLVIQPPQEVKAIVGKGIEGLVNGKRVRVGSPAFISETISIDSLRARIDEWQGDGKTVVVAAVDGQLLGALAIADAPKEHAKESVAALKRMGREVVMVTGDHRRTAEAIARELGIDQIEAEVLPGAKLEVVKRWQALGKRVAYVGDGINDAPALTQADLGIAMGSGTDVAIEAGQIVLVGGGPEKVVAGIKLTALTYRAIKQNLFWAFFYNVVAIPLAAVGLLNPLIASAAMALSSVSVVLNSIRIKSAKLH